MRALLDGSCRVGIYGRDGCCTWLYRELGSKKQVDPSNTTRKRRESRMERRVAALVLLL